MAWSFKYRIIIYTLVAEAEPVVEARLGIIIMGSAHMPFPHECCLVSFLLKVLREEFEINGQWGIIVYNGMGMCVLAG